MAKMRQNNQELREKVTQDNKGMIPNYFERRLVIGNIQFIIVPNGGTGDCLFKAIAQAISERDDETKHLEIRCQIVDYIIQNIWEKLKDSIEIQHMSGNGDLIEEWFNDPMKTYRTYMTTPGNLGSFIELTAGAELFQFNFASIQEYSNNVKTYRVENFYSRNFHHRPIFHFLFTGNGLVDGTYSGNLYIVIDGVQTSLDEWLKEMEEKNKASRNECKNSETCSDQSEGSGEEEEESHPDLDNTSASINEDESTRCHESDTNSSCLEHHHHHQNAKFHGKLLSETETDEDLCGKSHSHSYCQTNLDHDHDSTTSLIKDITSQTKPKLVRPSKAYGDTAETEKKKGCLRSIVSYVSSILR